MRPFINVFCISIISWTTLVYSIAPQQAIRFDPLLSSPLVDLHKSLIEHSSITGNEHNVTRFLTSYLSSRSFTVETQIVTARTETRHARHNILAYPGSVRQTRTLITSHIDTVPPFWPYEVRGENKDEIWGRGSVDAKGSVVCQIKAVESLLGSKSISSGDVAMLFVVGEETGGDGMRAANDLGLSWETVIFGEPTELKLASGHKGNMGLRIKATGKAGHSGYPELGRNANSMLVKALIELEGLSLPSSEKYGNSTLNIGRMEGGVAGNVIAEEAVAQLAIRIAGGTPEDVQRPILEAIGALGDGYEVEFSAGYGPVDIDYDVEGFEAIVVNYGTDIPNLKGRHKRYLYGPGDILVAHSDHEHLTISDLETAVEGYKTLLKASLVGQSIHQK